ncbi:hypothetical protein FisN_19Lh317 [Fistulifera solaris]|uniref:Uncharacterized protein n=1 Tax=Fistulifera solaris TaxID=1519565 RepID=A0A1Z5K7M4_FISSO|nr:hypothetical protein FisN_19Lh317 [Fistulifera solaris]|eukprot:GAX22247.1 hypothetical protein FisN_19Lh317 [Fistulifera solaris]
MFSSSKAKKEKSKTFLSFLRRKKKSAREETIPNKDKKEGVKAKKCPSSIMETNERKMSKMPSTKTKFTATGSMCDESDSHSIYSIDVMAEASWMPAPESNETTPQRYLDELLKERGYEKERYDCLKTGYYNAPTKLQIASYHAHLVSLVKQNSIETIADILACGLSPNPCNEFGSSLLQIACRRGNVELLEIMLRHGCSLQVADEFGRTPLHNALYAKQPAFALVKRILQVDPHLINMADSRGHLAFDYVRKEHCDEWIAFLDKVVDEIWPTQSEQPPPHPLTLRQANTEPLADPSNALSLDLAEAVASGKLRPCEALMLQNENFSDIDDSSSDYDSSYSSSLGSISEGSEESFEDEELVKELALIHRRSAATTTIKNACPTIQC